MSGSLFVKFTEHNDHEGETWHYWLQWQINQTQIEHLRKLIADNEDQYELADYVREEDEVDVLVDEADCGYTYSHNKVVGELRGLPESIDWESWDDPFYKGGIRDFFYND